jgi:hypothetical protein
MTPWRLAGIWARVLSRLSAPRQLIAKNFVPMRHGIKRTHIEAKEFSHFFLNFFFVAEVLTRSKSKNEVKPAKRKILPSILISCAR